MIVCWWSVEYEHYEYIVYAIWISCVLVFWYFVASYNIYQKTQYINKIVFFCYSLYFTLHSTAAIDKIQRVNIAPMYESTDTMIFQHIINIDHFTHQCVIWYFTGPFIKHAFYNVLYKLIFLPSVRLYSYVETVDDWAISAIQFIYCELHVDIWWANSF